MPRWAIRLTSSRFTATPTRGASTIAKTLPAPSAMSTRHFADGLDLDGLPREHDEGRRPAERDLADAVAIHARDRLDDAGLGIDDHRRLGALRRHHAGLDSHRRGADGALAARNVVAPGIEEEEPEVRRGRDRLRHHGDQQASVSARLQAEPGPEMVSMLLKPAALFAHRASGIRPEAAREQPHPDARGVEVDGRDHPIGSHGCLRPPGIIAQTMRANRRRRLLTPTPRSGGGGRSGRRRRR